MDMETILNSKACDWKEQTKGYIKEYGVTKFFIDYFDYARDLADFREMYLYYYR